MTANASVHDHPAHKKAHEGGAEKCTSKMKADLHDIAREAGRSSRNLIDAASHELEGSADSVATMIREKPLQSGAIALGLGVLLGMFFRRR